jgi:hypothetical protein
MDYFNHYSVPGSSKIGLFTSPQPKPVCILTLTPLPIWTESIGLFNTAQDYPYTYLEQQNLQHTDIRMTIETRGMVGKFTFSQLTATLVSAPHYVAAAPRPQLLLLNSGHAGGLSTLYSHTHYAHPPTRELGVPRLSRQK